LREIGLGAWAVGRWKDPEKETDLMFLMRNFAHTGKETP